MIVKASPGLNGFVISCFIAIFSFLMVADLARGDIIEDEAAQNLSTASLLWGPYKPNLYLGLRPRIPKSLTAGLLWGGLDSYERFQNSKITNAREQKPSLRVNSF